MTIGEQAQSPVRTGGRDGTYLDGIQILRFVAALAVVLAHIQHEIVKSGLFTNFRPFDLIDGGFGVDIFFVISGFIMLHVSKDKFGKSGASVDFIIRRFLRIAPLYYIATILTLVAILLIDGVLINKTITLVHMLGSFSFFPTQSSTGDIAPILKLGWTLNFEFFFYAIFSLSMIFRLRAGLLFLTFALTAIVLIANCVPHPPAWLSFWGQSLVFEFL
ncbi:acyltransferase, partial [uncultured Novosphingobium sp.]|uniref:acyltransferase family protein n=1 Tax=uncultured Novosphingobium sp. TaxID=292277 RepID=UPI00258D8848